MPTILERLARRRCYPVPIADDTFYVRSLTLGECDDVDKLPDELKTAYAIGCALTDDAGQQAMPRLQIKDQILIRTVVNGDPVESERVRPEANTEYATRVLDALQIVPPDALVQLTEAIWKVTKAAPVEDLVKN